MRDIVATNFLQKRFPKFRKIHREIPVLVSLSNTVNCPHWSAKRKKNIMSDIVATNFLQKRFPKFRKIHREIPVLVSLSNTVNCLQADRFATLLKRDSTLVFQNQPFIDPL